MVSDMGVSNYQHRHWCENSLQFRPSQVTSCILLTCVTTPAHQFLGSNSLNSSSSIILEFNPLFEQNRFFTADFYHQKPCIPLADELHIKHTLIHKKSGKGLWFLTQIHSIHCYIHFPWVLASKILPIFYITNFANILSPSEYHYQILRLFLPEEKLHT